ncbi:sugar ABC transporter ATP-binding protein [Paraburkholderia sp. B3]|uniref:sugar ABC transporter ATP-binding protein n=1 Tax=Paraburkholderia sp. B3 TaxID=3134791 RepID=UPI00398248EF
MTEAVELLSARSITKRFANNTVLSEVSLDVKSGEVHALIGENGAGKSTLMNILSGALPPSAGEIHVDGRAQRFRDPGEALSVGIAMMHQEPKVAEALSVAENVLMGRLPARRGGWLDAASMRARVEAALQDVGASFGAAETVGRLSVAQRQLVQLAKAITQNARVIVLDEPTASLTPVETRVLFSVMRRLSARGVAFIYISHHLDEIFDIAQRVTVLRDGRNVVTKAVPDTTRDELICLMVGRDLGSHFPPRRVAHPGEPVLETRSLSGPGFSDVSLCLRRGEIVGMAGLVGAGRTELARVLCGAERATHGDLLLDGQAVTFRNPAQAVARGIAYLAEDRRDSVLRPLSIQQNITLAARRSVARAGFIDAAGERREAQSYVGKLRIRTTSVEQPAGQLSGGNQQKCVIARWLMQGSRVLIFDEPTRGIDVGAKREIYTLIHELADQGYAILMISSELPEVISISDRILVMCEGRMRGELIAAEATEDAVIQLAVPNSRSETRHV